MKHFTILAIMYFVTSMVVAQPAGYYNGTEGKNGETLKSALHNIIKGHRALSYTVAKDILAEADRDPNNPSNVILVYTGRSADAYNYGTGGDDLNREHVWAKSHGDFGTDPPEGSDAHNLKPADGSVNSSRSNKDFDNCRENGTQHTEATGCYYTSDAWEPRDEVKGDIARIIFYMAVRYEGDVSGELDLEVNDQLNNSPNPLHGRLSALLEWHRNDPPDAFEKNRNDVIFSWQENRNPFIDNPEFVDMIWENAAANNIQFSNMLASPLYPAGEEAVVVSALITANGSAVESARLVWGTSYDNMTNELQMSTSGTKFSAEIPGQAGGVTVYYELVASNGGQTAKMPGNYTVSEEFTGTITSIYDIQGQGNASPFEDQIVSTTGIVTAVEGSSFFLQNNPAPWEGIYVYSATESPKMGDSVIVTGTVDEYYTLTELTNVTFTQIVSSDNKLPEPIEVSAADLAQSSSTFEQYEGVLVRLYGLTCTAEIAQYGLWKASDGENEVIIHVPQGLSFSPQQGKVYDITGIANYTYSENKIELRLEDDAVLVVDSSEPEIEEVETTSRTVIKITFSEVVTENSALNILNYAVDNGIAVQDARFYNADSKHIVSLATNEMEQGVEYTLTVSDVADLDGNAMAETNVTFTATFVGFESLFARRAVQLAPNPSGGNFAVELDANRAAPADIQVFDSRGRLVYNARKQLQNGRNEFELQMNLPSGFYQLLIRAQGAQLREKIMIY